MSVYEFNDLTDAPLVIDAVYKSRGTLFGDDPLGRLLPKLENQGGFRRVKRNDGSGNLAYIVLYITQEVEWPDYLDRETGLLRYYGDNRTPGKALHDTHKKGNRHLREIFSKIDIASERKNIPPFLVFQWAGNAFDAKFLGIATPSNPNIPVDRELNAIWRSSRGDRFQNYEAYFTILDTGQDEIDKRWLESLIYDNENSERFAPDAWKKFIRLGRHGITPLQAHRISEIPSKTQQLPQDKDGLKMLDAIRRRFQDNPYGFELCATKIIQAMDSNFELFEVTRPWRDGGRDAIGRYKIGVNGTPLFVECALEAKCYSENNSVGVRPMSRLISRIKTRQFGVLVTTSYVHSQAYQEIIDDGHPILIINACDIANILRSLGYNSSNIDSWLNEQLENSLGTDSATREELS